MSNGLSDPNEYVNVLAAKKSAKFVLTPEEREAIIQDTISTQRIEGIEVSYERVAAIVDKVFAGSVPELK